MYRIRALDNNVSALQRARLQRVTHEDVYAILKDRATSQKRSVVRPPNVAFKRKVDPKHPVHSVHRVPSKTQAQTQPQTQTQTQTQKTQPQTQTQAQKAQPQKAQPQKTQAQTIDGASSSPPEVQDVNPEKK